MTRLVSRKESPSNVTSPTQSFGHVTQSLIFAREALVHADSLRMLTGGERCTKVRNLATLQNWKMLTGSGDVKQFRIQ